MSTEIYYFSGTGNSLAVARDIAEKTKGTLISIPAVMDKQNIKMIENKPVWQHHCEMCLACVEWCPIKAIHHYLRIEGKDYHHPNVKISDMFRQNQYT